MPRIAKESVYKAFELAAKLINEAGGKDRVISRAELKTRLATLPKEQAAMVDVFYRFIDARDAARGARVTGRDVASALAFAKEAMVAKYDLNHNGLSQAEVARMSLTGRTAVELARALEAGAREAPVAPPRRDEGYSEPAEILAAGQVPRDWAPEVHLESGQLQHQGQTFQGLTTTTALTRAQREVADAAFDVLWQHVFQHRADNDSVPLEIAPNRQGTMKLGEFTRSDDGKKYLVADWRDIDDSSFTLYFERLQSGKLRLAIEQFNN